MLPACQLQVPQHLAQSTASFLTPASQLQYVGEPCVELHEPGQTGGTGGQKFLHRIDKSYLRHSSLGMVALSMQRWDASPRVLRCRAVPAVCCGEGPAALQCLGPQAGEPVCRGEGKVFWLGEASQRLLHLRLLRQQPGSQGLVLHGLPAGNATQAVVLVDSEVADATCTAGNESAREVSGGLTAWAAAAEAELLLEGCAPLRHVPDQVVAGEVTDLHRIPRGDGPDGNQLCLSRVLPGDDHGVRQAAVVCPADGGEDDVVSAATILREGEGVHAEDTCEEDHLFLDLVRQLCRLRSRLPELRADASGEVLVSAVEVCLQDLLWACAPAARDAALGRGCVSAASDDSRMERGMPAPTLEARGQRAETEIALPHQHAPGHRWPQRPQEAPQRRLLGVGRDLHRWRRRSLAATGRPLPAGRSQRWPGTHDGGANGVIRPGF
mmetsp:Transcript_65750/g.195661  ORF Transcript_65750/g.195661 Transcript_65750/m.195661 type:complete len:439 (-) Transcript_65750:1-1317(-)